MKDFMQRKRGSIDDEDKPLVNIGNRDADESSQKEKAVERPEEYPEATENPIKPPFGGKSVRQETEVAPQEKEKIREIIMIDNDHLERVKANDLGQHVIPFNDVVKDFGTLKTVLLNVDDSDYDGNLLQSLIKAHGDTQLYVLVQPMSQNLVGQQQPRITANQIRDKLNLKLHDEE